MMKKSSALVTVSVHYVLVCLTLKSQHNFFQGYLKGIEYIYSNVQKFRCDARFTFDCKWSCKRDIFETIMFWLVILFFFYAFPYFFLMQILGKATATWDGCKHYFCFTKRMREICLINWRLNAKKISLSNTEIFHQIIQISFQRNGSRIFAILMWPSVSNKIHGI